MPVTLAATINSTTRNLTLSGAIAGIAAGDLYLIEDELVQFYSYKTPRNPRLLDPTQIVVTRGVAGTTAASHNSTTPVQAAVLSYAASDDETKPDPVDAGGGGGVSVDNGVDPPVDVTTIIAAGADVSTPDQATLLSGLPMVIVRDNTGGTIDAGDGVADPTPRTVYTVVRDDLGAAADTSDYPILPAGVYLVGGYVDWVPGGVPPAGHIAADIQIETSGLYPEGDIGPDVWHNIDDLGNVIVAPAKLVTVPAGTDLHMILNLRGDWAQSITWVRWVFWAIQIVAS